ncbi:MAG: sigma-70 family RNA polymerase sigma factor [Planctomycetes bacterium]|jgi:RNA polymerase sigma-70 factor (ECF subfamily)|nr:sigma-70 family RNA polymerase sigma factor [Planctomycetota bacterium]
MTAQFHTTRWSLVIRATADDRATAQLALGELCEAYWQPLYAHARRSGHGDDDARDLVQSFCAELLSTGAIDGAAPERGRFRQYVLGAFRNFGRNHRRSERTLQRGGGVQHWSFEDAAARYAAAVAVDDSPEQAFERRWALDLLARAQARLQQDYATPAKAMLLAALAPRLLAPGDRSPSPAIVALGLGDGALRVALHRLRKRLRELVRDEVAQTVDDPAHIDDELQALRAALGSAAVA